eukprot:g4609.t1
MWELSGIWARPDEITKLENGPRRAPSHLPEKRDEPPPAPPVGLFLMGSRVLRFDPPKFGDRDWRLLARDTGRDSALESHLVRDPVTQEIFMEHCLQTQARLSGTGHSCKPASSMHAAGERGSQASLLPIRYEAPNKLFIAGVDTHRDLTDRRPVTASKVGGELLAALMMPEVRGSQLLGGETVDCVMYFDEEGFSEDEENKLVLFSKAKTKVEIGGGKTDGGEEGADVNMQDAEQIEHKFANELKLTGPKVVQKHRDRPCRTVGEKPDRVRIRREHLSESNPRNVVVPSGVMLEEYLFPTASGCGTRESRPQYVLPHGFHLMSVTQIMGGQAKSGGKGESRKRMMIQPGAVAGYFAPKQEAQEESEEMPAFPQNLDPLVRAAAVGDYVVGVLFWKRNQRAGKSMLATEPRLLRKVREPRDVVHAYSTTFPERPDDIEPSEELARVGDVAGMSFEELKVEIEKISTQAIEKRMQPLEDKVSTIEVGLKNLEEKTDHQHEMMSGQIRNLSDNLHENTSSIEKKVDENAAQTNEILRILKGEGGTAAGAFAAAATAAPARVLTKEFKRNMRENVLAVENAMHAGASYTFGRGESFTEMRRDIGTFFISDDAAVVGFERYHDNEEEISDVDLNGDGEVGGANGGGGNNLSLVGGATSLTSGLAGTQLSDASMRDQSQANAEEAGGGEESNIAGCLVQGAGNQPRE